MEWQSSKVAKWQSGRVTGKKPLITQIALIIFAFSLMPYAFFTFFLLTPDS